MKTDSRYPYTYACDYMRAYGGFDKEGTKMSRSDASKVRSAIAVAIGMTDEELAIKLADHYKANQEAVDAYGIMVLQRDTLGVKA